MAYKTVDPASIGTDRQYQDPEQACRAAHGTYDDEASRLSPEAALPMLPRAPAPSPFGGLRRAGGSSSSE